MKSFFCNFKSGSLLALGLGLVVASSSLPVMAITFRVDETGFHPSADKRLLVEDVPKSLVDSQSIRFLLISRDKKDVNFFKKEKVVFEPVVEKVLDESDKPGPPSCKIWLDFSGFKTAGSFILKAVGAGDQANVESQPIKLSEYLYWDTLKTVVRAFYFQRSGQAVGDDVLGVIHFPSHMKDAFPPEALQDNEAALSSKTEDVVGGWYDGSDYSKYTTSTSLTLGKLLALYESNPKSYQFFKVDYPSIETGVGELPDLLHEIEYGLDWLLVMQRSDGAYYSKVAGKTWPGNIRPENDAQKRFIFDASTQDTAAGAATMAMAARILKKKDIAYSIKCLRAAEKAWAYLESPEGKSFSRVVTPFDTSGSLDYIQGQKPGDDLPYRLWAACELYLSTQKPVYQQFILKNLKKVQVSHYSVHNPAFLGLTDYVIYGGDYRNHEADQWIRTRLTQLADTLVLRQQESPLGITLMGFEKDSNLRLVEENTVLLRAYKITAQESYLKAATQNSRFLFGINPLGKVFLTAFEPNGVRHASHRQSIALK
ncbi:MAG: glycoside hydrolase family 9 protein, partial [Cyanobacteria bacterium]|nr:glycoside hydrolase family 9 protein [Cyanobacteriota bacterium]